MVHHLSSDSWKNRSRVVSQQTGSGRVVYDRPKHYWTLRDLKRVMKKVEDQAQLEPPNALEVLLSWALAAWIRLMDLYAAADYFGTVRLVQNWARDAIYRLVGVTRESWSSDFVAELINVIASKSNDIVVTIKPK